MNAKLIAVAILALLPATAGAMEADAKKSVEMLSNFQCFQWARMSGDMPSVERHFDAAMAAGRVFLTAAEAGTITPEEANTIVPMSVGMTMSGPSHDFILGRMFEFITSDAFDDIAKEDPSGMPRDIGDWITDAELLKGYAEMKYRASNCGLLP
jgi:hypothetical protein